MPGPVEALAAGIQDSLGTRAVAKVSPNLRAKTATGFIGTLADVVTFPGPTSVVGFWIVANTRTLAAGVPTIGAASTGMAFGAPVPPPPPTGPMTVVQPDARVRAM